MDEAVTGVHENKERYDKAEMAAQRKPNGGRNFYYPPDIEDD